MFSVASVCLSFCPQGEEGVPCDLCIGPHHTGRQPRYETYISLLITFNPKKVVCIPSQCPHPGQGPPPPVTFKLIRYGACAVDKRAVRILLECFLVFFKILSSNLMNLTKIKSDLFCVKKAALEPRISCSIY